jgi:hypothetical protein
MSVRRQRDLVGLVPGPPMRTCGGNHVGSTIHTFLSFELGGACRTEVLSIYLLFASNSGINTMSCTTNGGASAQPPPAIRMRTVTPLVPLRDAPLVDALHFVEILGSGLPVTAITVLCAL